MFSAYEDLIKVVKPEEVIKITLGEVELDKEATFELMKKTIIDDIVTNSIVFWTKDSVINIIVDYSYYDEKIYFKETKLK